MNDARARILRLLRHGTLTPSELAIAAGVVQRELHAHIEALEKEGFSIPLHPLLGYEVRETPESLVAEDIASRMEVPWLRNIEVLSVTHSTNSLALEYGMRGELGPLAFFAESQTAGRGRFGRVWESSSGEGLWMSLLLHLVEPMRLWPRLTTLTALAVAQALEGLDVYPRLHPQIKWPNDVVCGGKKVAGILAETGSHPKTGPFLVLGIGINVNQAAFSKEIAGTASSLRILSGTQIDRSDLAARLLGHIHLSLSKIDAGFPAVLEAVKARSCVMGTHLRANSGGTLMEGVAENLDPDGCLLLRLEDGTLHTLSAGEVTLRE